MGGRSRGSERGRKNDHGANVACLVEIFKLRKGDDDDDDDEADENDG